LGGCHLRDPVFVVIDKDYGGDSTFDLPFPAVLGVDGVVLLASDELLPIRAEFEGDIVNDVVEGMFIVCGKVNPPVEVIMESQRPCPGRLTRSRWSADI
jgi:hypothetical protein